METALIGLLGVLIGLLVNEHFRRRNRIEAYSFHIFDKRMQIYAELYSRVNDCSEIIDDLIENPQYSKEERHDIVSAALHNLAQYGDANSFYLDNQIIVQYMTLMIGVEDIYYIRNMDKKEKEIERVYKHLRDTKNMIKKEAGIEELGNLFKSITRARHKSQVVDAYNELERERRKREKKLRT
jgi:polyhydroxyalkanoate synthesis regulator phasin